MNNRVGVIVLAARADTLDGSRAPEVVRTSPLAAHRGMRRALTKVRLTRMG
ncbi:hypothetical protein [Labrys sp. 22185]|uniref:hypothetical protein n=1 Tax=Labrys sp. 22185 TaxID=3453888 RepID=UPI003F8724C4